MSQPLLLTPAVPADFIVVSLWPKTKTTTEFNMEEGVMWAPERTAHHFEIGADDNIATAKDPLFYVRLSKTVSQVPGTDKFKGEENMAATLTSSGVKNVKIRKTKWGDFPVLALTGQAKSGLAMFTAFLGINSPDGWVIAINYRIPTAKGHPTDEEKKIWERFLNETKP
ncbi:hypothetical protein BH09VER1_BH09VER1_12690 [soil metagenome]